VQHHLAGGESARDRPKAIVVPHAGYPYSGRTAGRAYAALAAARPAYTRVVLIGPAHHVALRGLAVPSTAAFATPLGAVPIDACAVATLGEDPAVTVSDLPHADEHSLEVQLPFLQLAVRDFSLVPIVAGDAEPATVARVLARVWGGPETLIVVSSDLSHYHRAEEAELIDAATSDRILSLDASLGGDDACGCIGLNGLLLLAAERGLTPRLIDRCHSGDTAGDRRRVVGYAAFAFRDAES
jgi:MEMO1 family protein